MKSQTILRIFILGSFLVIPLFGMAQETPDGTLIRAEGDYKIYTIFNGQKRWIKNIDVFNSYGYKWTNVQVVSPAVLKNIAVNNLIRESGDIKVYALNDAGYKRHIINPVVFESYGFQWEDVAEVSNDEVTSYSDSNLIRQVNDPKVYYLENGKKRWVESPESFYTHNFNWEEIHVINSSDVNSYEDGEVIAPESSMERTSQATPSVPAQPAQPAVPAQPIDGATSTIPAVPAVPATPATPAVPHPDTTAPVISNIQATNITKNSATITWATDEPADSRVSYATTSISNRDYTTGHSINLINLSASTTYYYVVSSTDSNNNTATSSQQSFITLPIYWKPQIVGPYTDYRPNYTPQKEWNGSEYGVVWHDSRAGNNEIYFVKRDANGNNLTNEVRITNDLADSYYPRIAWNGSEFGVVWQDDRDRDELFKLYFARISNDAVKLTDDIKIVNGTTQAGGQKVVWTGSKYGVAYYNGDSGVNEIYLALVSSAGTVEKTVRVSYHVSVQSEDPSLVWTGSEFGIAWHDAGVFFAKFDANGNSVGSEVKIVNIGAYTSISYDGTLYTVTWNNPDGNTYSASGK